MRKYKNLIGQKFGRLTVVSEIIKNNRKYCLCKCDCGNEKLIAATSVISERTKSCGCLLKEIKKYKDLTGLKFGKLTVIEIAKIEKRKTEAGNYISNAFWLCKCDCGNETIVKASMLLQKRTTSCGCVCRKCSSDSLKKNMKLSAMSYTNVDNTILMMLLKSLNYTKDGRKIGVFYNKYHKRYVWWVSFGFRGKRILKNYNNYNEALNERLKLEKKYSIPFIIEHKTLLKNIDIDKYLNAEPQQEFDYIKYESERNKKL
jgi:hypothetical protein